MQQLRCFKVSFSHSDQPLIKSIAPVLNFLIGAFSSRSTSAESLLCLNAEPCGDAQWIKGRTIEIENLIKDTV